MLKTFVHPIGFSILFVLLMVISLSLAQSNPPVEPPKDFAKQRVQMAQEIVKALEEREAGGQAVTAEFMTTKSDWARKLTDARLALANSSAEKLAIVTEYVAATKRVYSQMERQQDMRSYNIVIRIARYDVVDAEARLEELKSR